jgi:hypothetical protein
MLVENGARPKAVAGDPFCGLPAPCSEGDQPSHHADEPRGQTRKRADEMSVEVHDPVAVISSKNAPAAKETQRVAAEIDRRPRDSTTP